MDSIKWPVMHLPAPLVAGQFCLADQGFATTYRSRNHALHLHGYEGGMRLAGSEIAISRGDLTVSPAGMPSSYDLGNAGRHWCIHFAPADANGDSVALPLHVSLGRAATAAQEQIAHIAQLLGSNSRRDQARASLVLQELLLWIDDHINGTIARASVSERAAALIDERFHEPLAVREIARTLGASQAHLARSFRARFGVTMQSRLLSRRMAHARYLLELTDLPIWRIAERVGIPGPSTFQQMRPALIRREPIGFRQRRAGAALIDPGPIAAMRRATRRA